MTRKRDQQQPIFRDGRAEVGQATQNVHTRRLSLHWLARRQKNYLVLGKASVTHQRIGDHASVIVRSLERTNLWIQVFVYAYYQRPTLGAHWQRTDLAQL